MSEKEQGQERGGKAMTEYMGCLSCWIEEDDDPPTAQQLVDGLARAALLWGGTPSGCKGSLRFYAGQMRRYKKLLLERLEKGEEDGAGRLAQ